MYLKSHRVSSELMSPVQLTSPRRSRGRILWPVPDTLSVGWWRTWSDVSVTMPATTQTLWTLKSSLPSSSSTSLPCPQQSLLEDFWVKKDVSVRSVSAHPQGVCWPLILLLSHSSWQNGKNDGRVRAYDLHQHPGCHLLSHRRPARLSHRLLWTTAGVWGSFLRCM